jgi:hypothetical protein
VKDLDIRCETSAQAFAAKGPKPFSLHAPLAHFEESWTQLDKICMQKQNKTTFKTNGDWNSREQLEKYPCGIIIRCVSPSITGLEAYGGMGTV